MNKYLYDRTTPEEREALDRFFQRHYHTTERYHPWEVSRSDWYWLAFSVGAAAVNLTALIFWVTVRA